MPKSKIEWTEKTWNPLTGCTKISAGCKNCYAEAMFRRFEAKWGKFTDVRFHPDRLDTPLKWKKPCRVFVNSMSDLFHESIGYMAIAQIVGIMRQADWHTYQILTKRPDRVVGYSKSGLSGLFTAKNIWIGVSVENQSRAEDISEFLSEIRAEVSHLWLSVEPLLEKISLWDCFSAGVDWVVVGCESGPKRRECKLEWIEYVVEQCREAKIPVFVKQIQINGKVVKNLEQFPPHLRIRQYPKQ